MVLDPRITFSRHSLATYFDAMGILRYANHNQIWSSQTFTEANWAKRNGATVTAAATTAPDGTTTATRLNHVTAGTVVGGNISQDISEIPYRAIWSVYAKAGSKNLLVLGISPATADQAYFNLSTGTIEAAGDSFVWAARQDVGGGWYRCWVLVNYITGVPMGTRMTIGVAETAGTTTCTSPGNIFIWGAQHQWVTLEEEPGAYIPTTGASFEPGPPRFDYDPITHQSLGMLMEEARMNRALSSQHNTNTEWIRTGAIVDADVIDAPDFTITADRMTATASPATTSQAITQSAAYTVSVFALRGTSDWVYLVGQSADSPRAWFNLATGTVGTIDAGLTEASIQDVGGGWYRCTISDVGASTGNENCTLGISDADNSTTVTVGKTIFLWGWQNEAGSFATSYIPCQTAPFQRAVDVAVMTGSNFSSWFHDGTGTFVADFVSASASGARPVLSADSGITLDSIRLLNSGTDPKAVLIRVGAAQADLDLGTVTANALAKSAISYAANDVSGCFNGGTVVTDTSATMPLAGNINQLRIGSDGANPFAGHIRRIRFYNVTKSDPQIQVLTSLTGDGGGGITGTLAATEGADIAAADNAIVGMLSAVEGADIAIGTVDFLNLDLDFATTLDPRVTFSRASVGTHYDSAGVLKIAAHNLALQSQTFQTTWSGVNGGTVTADATTAPDGTTTADRLNHVTAGTVTGGAINQGLTQPAHLAIFSIYAKAGSKNFVTFGTIGATLSSYAFFNLTTGAVATKGSGWVSSGIEDAGSGWYRCWGVAATVATVWVRVAEVDNSLSCTSPGDIYLWGAQFEWVTTATIPGIYLPTTTTVVSAPRFDFDPVTHAAKGLLVEESRINSAQSSQAFDNGSWTKTGATVTANAIAAPDGTTTADRITSSASPATVSFSTSSGNGLSYVQSFYAKKGTSDWVYTIVQSTADAVGTPRAWFNLNTGAVGTVESPIVEATIQDVGGGWYRCTASRIAGSISGARLFVIAPCDANNSTTVTVGRTTYLWGAQFETFGSTFATSYIPTAPAATATRAADVAVMTGSSFSSWYYQPAGTFVAACELRAASGTRPILSADNNATTERIFLFGSGTDPKLTVTDGGATQADLDLGTLTTGSVKIGASFALNDVAGCFAGGTVGTDTAATMPTPTQLRIGTEGTNYLNGWMRSIKFYCVAKSDAELAALTA